MFYLFLVLRSYDPKTMMIYCPTAVATVLNIWCSVASLLLRLPPPAYHLLPATGTLYIYDILLLSYDVPVHMKSSRPKKGLKQFATKILAYQKLYKWVMTYTN